MTILDLELALAALREKPSISAEDTLAVRRAIYQSGRVSQAAADALFEINDGASEVSPAWREFFVEALVDYTVRQQRPAGYVDDATAEWLLQRIARDGKVKGQTELSL